MNKFQSPQSLPKKTVQFESSSQQQRSTMQKLQETANSDLNHLTASFGMTELQQGGFKNLLKNNNNNILMQEKNQDLPRIYNNVYSPEMIIKDDINQRDESYDNIIDNYQYKQQQANQELIQNPNELYSKSQEYNEDTLHQQQILQQQNQYILEQQQYQQQQNANSSRNKNYKGSHRQNPMKDSKIQTYLQQMMNNTNYLKNTENSINNFTSQPSAMSAYEGSQMLQNFQSEDNEMQRNNPPPQPESLGMVQLTYGEIAHLKQKQRQLSEEKIKASKQKKLLDEIAHFYRQLAVKKKEDQNNRSIVTSPSPIRKSSSTSRLRKKSPQNNIIQNKQVLQQSDNRILQNSQSVISTYKAGENKTPRQDKQSTVKQNMRYQDENHSKSVQQFQISKADTLNENQENQTDLPNQLIQAGEIQEHQQQDINTMMVKGNIQTKSQNQLKKSQELQYEKITQLQKNALKKPTQANNRFLNQNGSALSIDFESQQIISLSNIFILNPVQFQALENKIKKYDISLIKQNIIQKYRFLIEKVKFSNETQNYLSTLKDLFNEHKIMSFYDMNMLEKIQVVNKLSIKDIFSNIKETIDLTDSYETITQDIQQIQANQNNRKHLKTTIQQEKELQTLQVLKDMQMRMAQKIFFIYLFKVQSGYKKEIIKQLDSFEKVQNELRLTLTFNMIKYFAKIRSYKNQLQKITKQEIQLKKLKKIFDAIKQKSNKNIYYKPFIQAIRSNRRKVLKQNSLYALFEYCQSKKSEKKQLYLSQQIYNSHLITKSYLILKAFCNRKKNNTSIQTMTAKNISIQYILELKSVVLQAGSSFRVRQELQDYNLQDEHFEEKSHKMYQNRQQNILSGQNDDGEEYNNQEATIQNQFNILDNQFIDENQQFKQSENKSQIVKKQLNFQEYDDQFCEEDVSYDSKQFQKHFYCEEEFLSSARNLLDTKRQIALDKLDKLKHLTAQSVQNEDQSSFLQKNKEKVQEIIRENYEYSNEKPLNIQESDTKMNLVQIPPIKEEILRAENINYNKELKNFDQSLIDDQNILEEDCKSIVTLEQHIKQIIRVLKKLSKKKTIFQQKNPVQLLLNKDSFFYSSGDNLSKQQMNGKQSQKNIPHPLQEHQEMIKRIEENEKKKTISFLFYHWKIVFLERTLNAEITLLNSLKKCKSILQIFKKKYRENNEICTLKQQIREEKIKSEIFQSWSFMASETSQANQEKLQIFHKKLCFRRILYYSTYKKIQRVADGIHRKNLQKKILNQWDKISKSNQVVRKKHKNALVRRYFNNWVEYISKIMFLRKFWKKILYSPDEILFEKYGNKKNLLKHILKSWRGIVIDNENTMKQKLALKSAVNHRAVVQKTKAFFQWVNFLNIKKKLSKIFESKVIQKMFAKKILQPWKSAVAEQKSAISTFKRKANMNIKFKAFHCLKIKYLQNKMVENCFLKKFFYSWKVQQQHNQEILPRNFYSRKLVKKSFTSIIYHQLLQMKERAKTEKSTKFFLYHIKKFMQTCLLLWQKHTQKKKSKKLLKIKLQKYSEKNIKKRAFNSLKLRKIQSRLKIIQNKKALEFKAIQYQKKYDLKRLITDPHLNPKLQEVLQIIHYWRAYAIKQKSIKFIQARIQKFHNRKILIEYFTSWQNKYNQKLSLKNQAQFEEEEQQDIVFDRYSSKQNVYQNKIDSTTDNLHNNRKSKHSRQLSDQVFSKDTIQLKSYNQQTQRIQNDENQSLNKKDIENQSQFKEQQQYESTDELKQNNFISMDSQTKQHSSRSPRFLSNQSRNSKSPSSKSNSPNYNKSTLKTNQSQENVRKHRKSVRFELDPKQQGINIPKFDYFDQKYNENEAFYQKLLSERRYNTTQQ
ncbi:hypothetical protein TTHERM_00421190 (macronuclear) [Tetrahymena thermophila SB210]|uniref:Uncharacterized protein n=1 Tax=Tetrahymena thermophila (strain SB210) TaxID=312017 RepID=I7MD91_TETTS|nr:hypothetical protein TTHERM_00421190 [Tetrahymena thermophila SB210]EAR85710.2 hypothetical protein TTHERM_00421190 [Tetrahymena thermophila SB210]|eukprot:XP_001033373.2 hypothetical protein TTHERM_00421190 [Tetrahymena thermophila SB210]